MADLKHFNIKGGAIRTVRFAQGCNVNALACADTLPIMPRKVSWHDGTTASLLFSTFAPKLSLSDKRCVATDEIVPVDGGIAQVPADYTMFRIYVPAYSILTGLGMVCTGETDPYGLMADSFAGMQFDVQANEVDYDAVACQYNVGADVTVTAIPAAFANVLPVPDLTVIEVVSPATGGYKTGAKGLLISIQIDTPPTVGLSRLRGSITLQANVTSFNALIQTDLL